MMKISPSLRLFVYALENDYLQFYLLLDTSRMDELHRSDVSRDRV